MSLKMADIHVIFLGTGGSVPTPKRGLSAIAIKRKNEMLMFDCGEGTQRQMIQVGVGFHKKTKIFVTHLHGDHVLGLPGLLQTMSLLGRKNKLEIYGPIGIKDFINSINQTVHFTLTFPIFVKEITEGIVCQEKDYTITAVNSAHIDPSLAYAFFEKHRPGRFNVNKANELGVPEGPLWSKLQSGKSVKLSDGRLIKPSSILGVSRPGRTIIYSGDTGPSEKIVKLAKNADLLIHEATFDDEMKQRAIEDGHSTPSIAAETARKACVKQLIVTHISARYKNTNLLLEQAKKTFKNTKVAKDFMQLELPYSEN
ncbi:MAG: ribonuclease Z [Candidatus Bathyarchaeota archaeon]